MRQQVGIKIIVTLRQIYRIRLKAFCHYFISIRIKNFEKRIKTKITKSPEFIGVIRQRLVKFGRIFWRVVKLCTFNFVSDTET